MQASGSYRPGHLRHRLRAIGGSSVIGYDRMRAVGSRARSSPLPIQQTLDSPGLAA
jgi:hypothetical protein